MKNAGLFKEIVENSDNIIIVTDAAFNIQYISSAVEKTFEVEPQNLLGKNVFDFVNTDHIAAWKQCLQDQNNSLTDEISLTVTDGRKAYFDVQVINLIDGFGGLAMHLHNVTERKEREQELIRSNQQMDQVIYKTTHDLKAPLNSALALINLAQEASGEEKTMFIDMVKRSLLKLDTFIEEMNDFFRNDKLALQHEFIDLKKTVLEEIDGLRNLPETSRIEFSFKIDGDATFYSDSIRVRTVLTNLLSNAIKYSDLKKKEPFIRISISLNQEICDLRISDNGIGIDPKYLNKIYDLFFRATNHSQGTGLGLFIVRDTIQKLKGTIEVHSALNEGTTFQIQIPNQINQPVLVV
jgi:PAS domain S-box-containing protein